MSIFHRLDFSNSAAQFSGDRYIAVLTIDFRSLMAALEKEETDSSLTYDVYDLPQTRGEWLNLVKIKNADKAVWGDNAGTLRAAVACLLIGGQKGEAHSDGTSLADIEAGVAELIRRKRRLGQPYKNYLRDGETMDDPAVGTQGGPGLDPS